MTTLPVKYGNKVATLVYAARSYNFIALYVRLPTSELRQPLVPKFCECGDPCCRLVDIVFVALEDEAYYMRVYTSNPEDIDIELQFKPGGLSNTHTKQLSHSPPLSLPLPSPYPVIDCSLPACPYPCPPSLLENPLACSANVESSLACSINASPTRSPGHWGQGN